MKFIIKKQIANILTSLRIVLSIPLFFSKPFSVQFFVFYLLCGFTDMIDGTVARKTKSESKFGERLDSIADLVFVIVCLIKIIPTVEITNLFWFWILAIALIKISSVIIGFVTQKKFVSPHTIFNKITGFVLFIFPLTIPFIPLAYSIFFCCVVATVAAVHEIYIVKSIL